MFDKLTQGMDFQSRALMLRAERQRLIASNIANADTPGFQARDIDFAKAMEQAQSGMAAGGSALAGAQRTDARHMALPAVQDSVLSTSTLAYAASSQPSLDNNTVDLDRERASFADNAVRYEATLRFINGQSKTLLAAITGQ